jgi:hypothetical protein
VGTIIKTLAEWSPAVADALRTAASIHKAHDKQRAINDMGSAREIRMLVTYSTPSGQMKLVYLYWDLLANGRYNFAMFCSTTTFSVAPDIAVIYHESSKKSFLSSKSSTTVELREIARHIDLNELTTLGEQVTGWSLMFFAQAQKQLEIVNN